MVLLLHTSRLPRQPVESRVPPTRAGCEEYVTFWSSVLVEQARRGRSQHEFEVVFKTNSFDTDGVSECLIRLCGGGPNCSLSSPPHP
jgi:hypothetical protein